MFNSRGFRIRLLLEGDEPQCVGLLQFHTSVYMPQVEFDEATALESIRQYHDTGEPIMWVAEREDGLILGYAVGSLTGNRWSKALKCSLETIFVHPDARGGGHVAVALFREYDSWTRIVGASESYCGVIHGVDTKATARWMRRFGFHEVGTYLRKLL